VVSEPLIGIILFLLLPFIPKKKLKLGVTKIIFQL
jgi:hypothetical protein